MNWSRGLFRAWAVLTVVWVGGCAVALIGHWPPPPPARPTQHPSTATDWVTPEKSGPYKGFIKEPKPLTDEEFSAMLVADDPYGRAVWSHLSSMMLFAALPPAFLFAAGFALLWIARGFKA